jgi:hypothetical protein
MGFRVLLIAVKGKEPDAIHHDYGVVPTGQREEIPESPVTGAVLPSGAYLLYINDQIVPDNAVFARLSKGASVIACGAATETSSSTSVSRIRRRDRFGPIAGDASVLPGDNSLYLGSRFAALAGIP